MVDFRFIDDYSCKRKIQHDSGFELLQAMMHDRFGYCITESDIVRGENGKPFFRGFKDVFFNISHCDGLCCCIVSCCECGIDCEKIRAYRPNIIRRVFTDSESEWFGRLDDQDKPRFFFILWTLKEAFGKFTGRGIADMKNVSFSFENSILASDKCEVDFFVYQLDEYIISLCVKKGEKLDCRFGKQIY